jgi:hypothetical protein
VSSTLERVCARAALGDCSRLPYFLIFDLLKSVLLTRTARR